MRLVDCSLNQARVSLKYLVRISTIPTHTDDVKSHLTNSSPWYTFPTIWGTGDVLDGSLAPRVGPGEGSVGVDRPATSTGHICDL